MALYFFSLSDVVMFYHSGEDLPNDVAAVAHAALVATEIGMNKPLGCRQIPASMSSMLKANALPEEALETPPLPPCNDCALAYRLVGIEGTEKPRSDLYTFECPGCGHLETMTTLSH